MSWKLFGAIVLAAVSLALSKAWFSATEERPAPGASFSFDQLYPEAADAALKAKAQARE